MNQKTHNTPSAFPSEHPDGVHGLLVFGQTGQVASELQRLAPDAVFLGRAQADLNDPDACAATIRARRPLAVINAAAWTAVDAAETDEAAATVVNGAAPAGMAQACANLGIPFVHISTDSNKLNLSYFVLVYSSMIPTISYDFTMDVSASTKK